ncbi:MAG: putative metal-binding motif-containing protein [Deltaproteobacteria bacterium]|nr:putative metal-binding motif-containing protein [Deltaproteobacteria bacterium]
MSTSRLRCGSWLAWAVALAAGCADGGKGGEAKGGDGADAGADTAAVDCAAAPLDCDGEDNDCDDVTDEGGELEARQLWGVDADADGYSAAAPTFTCAGADGERAVTEALDCDDARAEAHPGAVEDCDAYGDEDCNGVERCADPACAGPACTEICDDGVDNDADGRTDCADSLCWGPSCPEDCTATGDEDNDGAFDCQDTDCWGAGCAEICWHLGDEDTDGLADCEDADCVEECIEDCEDGRDNDLDGTEDCDDLDCSFHAICWRELALRSPGPISARHWKRESEMPPGGYSSARVLSVRIPTATFSGLVKVGEGSSAWCSLHAYGLGFGYSLAAGHWPSGTGFRHTDFWVRASSYGEVAAGCPSAPEAEPVSLLDFGFTGAHGLGDPLGVVSYAHGRAWTLEDLTWGPAEVTSDRRSFSTWAATGWWRETSWVGHATGLAPVP